MLSFLVYCRNVPVSPLRLVSQCRTVSVMKNSVALLHYSLHKIFHQYGHKKHYNDIKIEQIWWNGALRPRTVQDMTSQTGSSWGQSYLFITQTTYLSSLVIDYGSSAKANTDRILRDAKALTQSWRSININRFEFLANFESTLDFEMELKLRKSWLLLCFHTKSQATVSAAYHATIYFVGVNPKSLLYRRYLQNYCQIFVFRNVTFTWFLKICFESESVKNVLLFHTILLLWNKLFQRI